MNALVVKRMTAVLPLFALVLCVANIWLPYSYWFDELFSVTISAQDLGGMFRDLLGDVHPPLYQVLLWAWIKLFGTSEPATRMLSLVFALAALAHLTAWSRKLAPESRLSLLLFFCTSLLLPYYAQETRSYAMTLFFASVLTTGVLDYDGSRRRFLALLAVSTLLALTHYFGLLLSLAAAGWLVFVHRRERPRLVAIVAVLALMATWPILQFLLGGLGGKMGGQFWIKVEGPLDTIKMAIKAPTHLSGLLLVFALIAVLARDITAEWWADKSYLARAGFLLLATLLAALLIDLHTPISTKRNFIVLLPVFSILFGLVVGGLLRHPRARPYAYVTLVVFALGNAQQAYKLMREKWAPLENWQASAALAVGDATSNLALYYIPFHDTKPGSNVLDALFNYYPGLQSGGRIRLAPLNVADIPSAPRPFLILFGHNYGDLIEGRLREHHLAEAVTIHYPPQTNPHATGVIRSREP